MKRIRKNKIYLGDCLEVLKTFPDNCIDMCVTSPPYFGLRDYGVEGQLGLEKTPEDYVVKMVEIFHEVKRVLKKEGTLWLNLGDSYSGSKGNTRGVGVGGNEKLTDALGFNKLKGTIPKGTKPKDLIGIPWMVAFALRTDGWYLRQDIIWNKPNPMPESVTDRCTKSHEYIFLLSKSSKYYYDADAIKDKTSSKPHKMGNKSKPMSGMGGAANIGNAEKIIGLDGYANKRDVWTVTTKSYKEAHFATFPEKLIKPCIFAGCPEGGIVLDPFIGAGTTAIVCKKLHRNYIGIELNPEYIKIAEKRINKTRETLFAI